MTRSSFALIAFVLTASLTAPLSTASAQAQAAAGDAQLRLIVIDQTSAGIPTATVKLTPPTGVPLTVNTDERGVAVIPAIPTGSVKVHVEFTGFDPIDTTISVRRGANTQTLTMKLAGLTDEVVVTTEQPGGETRGSAMVTELTKEEIEDLPDTPEDLQAYLEELAGPGGATFFLNGFRGGRLPTKDEIRSIRVRNNSFSADGHESGGRSGIEIVTRPSTQGFGGQVQLGYQGDALNARNALAQVETPEGNRQVEMTFRGPIVSGKTAFSLNVNGRSRYESNTIIALDPVTGARLGSQVRVPTDQKGVNASLEHALNNSSTLRLSYQRTQSDGRNQGLGQFDLPERASERHSSSNLFRAQVQGVLGRSMLNEFRVQYNRNGNESTSLSTAPTIIVQDAFNIGGAGVNSSGLSNTFEVADNFDFTPHKSHQMRVGFLVEGGSYNSFDASNATGRWTYASLEDFQSSRPLQYSQRLGTVDISYQQYQLGLYVQDDIRVNNRLSLGVGLRNEMQTHVNDRLNLMPRVGFSLNPGGNKTSIRGGYGMYYDWYENNVYEQTLRLNGQLQRDIQLTYLYDLDGNLIGNITPDLNRPSNRTVASPDLKLPYVHQFSLGVDRQLPASMQVQVTYQRLLGRNQLRGRDINYGYLDYSNGFPIRVRPDATSGIVTEIESNGRSVSDRVTFQVRRQIRTASGQQIGFINASYQLGKSLSDFSGATSLPSSSDDLTLDWGPQGQDIRHQFQVGGNIRLWYDFRLQGNLQLRSAPAYNLTTGFDDNFDGVINDRPIGVSRNSLRGESTWHVTQLGLSKVFGFGASREGTGGGGFPGGRGGGFPGGGGGGFRGGQQRGFDGGRGNFGQANNSRYQIQFSVQAQNPLNRVIQTGWTGNMRSPYFLTATGVQRPRQISFNTSFRF